MDFIVWILALLHMLFKEELADLVEVFRKTLALLIDTQIEVFKKLLAFLNVVFKKPLAFLNAVFAGLKKSPWLLIGASYLILVGFAGLVFFCCMAVFFLGLMVD